MFEPAIRKYPREIGLTFAMANKIESHRRAPAELLCVLAWIYIWVQRCHALRADAVRKARFRSLRHILLDRLPCPASISYTLTTGANWQQTAQRSHIRQCFVALA